jgi:hypothetical protein
MLAAPLFVVKMLLLSLPRIFLLAFVIRLIICHLMAARRRLREACTTSLYNLRAVVFRPANRQGAATTS